VASTLRQACEACDQALQREQTTLATHADTMSAQQLVQAVKNAREPAEQPAKGRQPRGPVYGLEYIADRVRAVRSARAGRRAPRRAPKLTESEELLDALQTKAQPDGAEG